jgi:hypothetical protein
MIEESGELEVCIWMGIVHSNIQLSVITVYVSAIAVYPGYIKPVPMHS